MKERELPDAYPSLWHDQVTSVTDKYGEEHAPIERELTAAYSRYLGNLVVFSEKRTRAVCSSINKVSFTDSAAPSG